MENVNFEGQPVNPEENTDQNINQNMDQNMNLNEAPRSSGAPNDGQGQENTKKKKLIWAGGILAALILAVAGWQYWQYTHSVYYQQMKAVKKLEAMEKESDKWGGKTPEETVRLFTEAVKKGDFELASKYGREEEIESDLEKIKKDGNIDLLVKDLENGILEESPGFAGEYFDLLIKDKGEDKYSVLTLRRSERGIWKIVTF